MTEKMLSLIEINLTRLRGLRLPQCGQRVCSDLIEINLTRLRGLRLNIFRIPDVTMFINWNKLDPFEGIETIVLSVFSVMMYLLIEINLTRLRGLRQVLSAQVDGRLDSIEINLTRLRGLRLVPETCAIRSDYIEINLTRLRGLRHIGYAILKPEIELRLK